LASTDEKLVSSLREQFVCVLDVRQIYSDWANHYLVKAGHYDRLVNDLQTDLSDGVLLADIIQAVSK